MTQDKSKLEKLKLHYEIWDINNKLDPQTLNTISQVIQSKINMVHKNLLYISSGAIVLSIPLITQLANIGITTFGKKHNYLDMMFLWLNYSYYFIEFQAEEFY